jgi:hypothetical protein
MMLGIPALACFLGYVGLGLSERGEVRSAKQKQEGCSEDLPPVTCHLSLQPICRAGAIVLLVGFWFDGGLFKLATAAPFWILLELGRKS